MVSVAAADVYTGPGVDVTLLYLGPIGFGTFFAGLGPGIGLALLAAVCGRGELPPLRRAPGARRC